MDETKNSTPLHLKTPREQLALPGKQTLILILSILFFIGGFSFWIYVNFMMK